MVLATALGGGDFSGDVAVSTPAMSVHHGMYGIQAHSLKHADAHPTLVVKGHPHESSRQDSEGPCLRGARICRTLGHAVVDRRIGKGI